MSSTLFQKSARYPRRRGWPVVATGTPRIDDWNAYRAWRARLRLPEESPDFSDRDVFDVLEVLLERERERRAARILRPALLPAPRACREECA